jgi:uncharacterized protein with GYD domain
MFFTSAVTFGQHDYVVNLAEKDDNCQPAQMSHE